MTGNVRSVNLECIFVTMCCLVSSSLWFVCWSSSTLHTDEQKTKRMSYFYDVTAVTVHQNAHFNQFIGGHY